MIGFDISKFKIERYKNGIDSTQEIGDEKIKNSKIFFTYDENDLKKASFITVAVPTPINFDKTQI